MLLTKRANKKAQEGIGGGPVLIALIILVIVGVLLILWYYGIFDTITRGTKTLTPSDVELVSQSCIIAAKGGLTTTFCKDFKKIKVLGAEEWINCQYPDIATAVEVARKENNFNIPICGNITGEATQFCEKLARSPTEKYTSDIRANGLRCGDLIGQIEIKDLNYNTISNGVYNVTAKIVRIFEGREEPAKNIRITLNADNAVQTPLEATTNAEGMVSFQVNQLRTDEDITVKASIGEASKEIIITA